MYSRIILTTCLSQCHRAQRRILRERKKIFIVGNAGLTVWAILGRRCNKVSIFLLQLRVPETLRAIRRRVVANPVLRPKRPSKNGGVYGYNRSTFSSVCGKSRNLKTKTCRAIKGKRTLKKMRKGLWTSPATAALTNPLVKQCAVGEPVTYYHIECENYLQDNIVTEGLKTTGGRTDIYTWNSRKNAYTRLGNMDSAKSKSA